MKKDLTILIPWSNRSEIQRTLPENIKYFNQTKITYHIIIINCGGDQEMLLNVLKNQDKKQIEIIHLETIQFNKSFALNNGLVKANSNYFMCLDADIIIQDIDFKTVFDKLEKNFFITIKTVKEENQIKSEVSQLDFEIDGITSFTYKIEFEKKNGKKIEIALNKNDILENTRSAPGIIIAKLEDAKKIHGYNSDLQGWGWEDIDFIARLLFAGIQREEQGVILHLTHATNKQVLDPNVKSKVENEGYNFQKCLINYQLGIFKGTLEKDSSITINEKSVNNKRTPNE